MKTFDQCKDEVAKNHGMQNWNTFANACFVGTLYEKTSNEAAELYAQEVAKDAFEAARGRVGHPEWDYVYDDFDDYNSKRLNTYKPNQEKS